MLGISVFKSEKPASYFRITNVLLSAQGHICVCLRYWCLIKRIY